MNATPYYSFCVSVCLVSALGLTTTGCKNLPGTSGEQGAAIGGVSGAAVGAAVGGEHHRLLGALVGGAAGAGGGYLIGANKDRITGHDTAGAQNAVERAQATPATPQQALAAPTADLNGDGFVTMDEVVAMKRAGIPDQTMLQRMQATGQVFELTPDQQQYLSSNGVDEYVINQIPEINRDTRNQLLAQPYPATPPPNTGATQYYPPASTQTYPPPPVQSYPPPARVVPDPNQPALRPPINPNLYQPVPPQQGP